MLRNTIKLLALLSTLALCACGDSGSEPPAEDPPPPPPPPPPAREFTLHSYEFFAIHGDEYPGQFLWGEGDSIKYQPLEEGFMAHSLDFTPQPDYTNELDIDKLPDGIVNTNAAGTNYFLVTEAPYSTLPFDESLTHQGIIGGRAEFMQIQGFHKDQDAADLTLTITRGRLEANDGNPGDPLPEECPLFKEPPIPALDPGFFCWSLIGDIRMEVWLRDREKDLDYWFGTVSLLGYYGHFQMPPMTPHSDPRLIFSDAQFDFEKTDTHAEINLRQPVVFHIPLAQIPPNTDFELVTQVTTAAYNRRLGESNVAVFFRDPQGQSGIEVSYSGITPIEPFNTARSETPVREAPACGNGADAAPGTIQIGAMGAGYPENGRAHFMVTRTNGDQGDASVWVRFMPGTAQPGVDYVPGDQLVYFESGDDEPRMVTLNLLDNGTEQPSRALTVDLADLKGCGQLGTPAHAELTILDDDAPPPPPPPTYSVGGTVTGLTGSGLQLHDAAAGGDELISANGSFAFDNLRDPGSGYDIRIVSQPGNPIQICTLSNGIGTVGDANVTNVTVTCDTPTTSGALDTTFGDQGRVSTSAAGAAHGVNAMALQPDGRIVTTLHGAGEAWLMRLNANGSIDTGFGVDGVVSEPLGFTDDELNSVAVQPDGKILAAGYALNGSDQDFLLKRYQADGSPDSAFGTGGTVFMHFVVEAADRSRAMKLLSDGRILLAGGEGHSPSPGVFTGYLTAAVFNADGSPDASFGGGRVTIPLSGYMPEAMAIVEQADGKFVLAGRARTSGSAYYDVVMARLNADGSVDTSYGSDGILRTRVSSFDDFVTDAVLLPDGKVMVSLYTWTGTGATATRDFGIARFNTDGTLDSSFGTTGLVALALGTADDISYDLELQSDGKLVVSGSSEQGSSDFALVRLNADGTRDDSFDGDGALFVDFFGGIDAADGGLLIQPDGKYLLGGVAVSGTDPRPALIRVLP